jgi:hypothetical protein
MSNIKHIDDTDRMYRAAIAALVKDLLPSCVKRGGKLYHTNLAPEPSRIRFTVEPLAAPDDTVLVCVDPKHRLASQHDDDVPCTSFRARVVADPDKATHPSGCTLLAASDNVEIAECGGALRVTLARPKPLPAGYILGDAQLG